MEGVGDFHGVKVGHDRWTGNTRLLSKGCDIQESAALEAQQMKEAQESGSISDVEQFLNISGIEAVYPIFKECGICSFRKQMTGQASA